MSQGPEKSKIKIQMKMFLLNLYYLKKMYHQHTQYITIYDQIYSKGKYFLFDSNVTKNI